MNTTHREPRTKNKSEQWHEVEHPDMTLKTKQNKKTKDHKKKMA